MGRLGLGQLCSGDDKEENLRKCRALMAEAKRQRVDLLSLPECFAYMGARAGASADAAEPLSGPLVTRYRELAAEFRLWLSLGGFHESPPDGDPDRRIYNTHLLIDDKGDHRAVYRKAHLFDADAGASGTYCESATTRPGPCMGALVQGTPLGALGLTTCYDLRFPAVYAALRDAGADAVLVPSAFMPTTGAAHWEVLLRARAIECQVYVGAAAQHGVHRGGRASYGYSMIVDPWGTVVANAGQTDDCVVSADIEMRAVEATRKRMPVVQHRRGDAHPVEIFGS